MWKSIIHVEATLCTLFAVLHLLDNLSSSWHNQRILNNEDVLTSERIIVVGAYLTKLSQNKNGPFYVGHGVVTLVNKLAPVVVVIKCIPQTLFYQFLWLFWLWAFLCLFWTFDLGIFVRSTWAFWSRCQSFALWPFQYDRTLNRILKSGLFIDVKIIKIEIAILARNRTESKSWTVTKRFFSQSHSAHACRQPVSTGGSITYITVSV